jgi:hypothetical protein
MEIKMSKEEIQLIKNIERLITIGFDYLILKQKQQNRIEQKLNKLLEQKAPKDRSDKADKIDKALTEKVK